jgi:hypothetical protein
MWTAACGDCEWTSGKRITKAAAEVMGQLHEEDHPGHSVVIKEKPNGTTPKKAAGESL